MNKPRFYCISRYRKLETQRYSIYASPLTCSRRNVQASREARESREHIKTVAEIRGKPFHSFGTRWMPSLAAGKFSTPPQNRDLSFHGLGSLKCFSLVSCVSAPTRKKKSPFSISSMFYLLCIN